MAPHWRGTSTAWRLVAAYLLVDPSFAIGTTQSYDGSRPRRQAHLHYLGAALVLMLIGGALAVLLFCIPTQLLEKVSVPLLVVAISMLALVFIPGLGHTVNGSRRWLQLAGLNFQASEAARVLVLIYLASYAVRREEELRMTFGGLVKPLGLLVFVGALLLAEPDFGAATVLFATGFGMLFLAGARLRYVIAMTLIAGVGFSIVAASCSTAG